MKTFTIELLSAETNFGQRALYRFSQELSVFLVNENGKVYGQPLGEDMAIFVTMMTRKEAEELKKLEAKKARATLKKSIK